MGEEERISEEEFYIHKKFDKHFWSLYFWGHSEFGPYILVAINLIHVVGMLGPEAHYLCLYWA